MKKILLKILISVVGIYLLICGILYSFQEKIIFHPEKLEPYYEFQFNQDFEELNFKMEDGTSLNGLLFKAENSKGLIFYLHGNAGSLKNWGSVADLYTQANYDTFVLDYRGYGKSDGKIKSEQQLFKDNQTVYNELKKRYSEDQIIVLGYSIGTGMAAKLASENHPKKLILQAPYYSLTEIMKENVPIIPTIILKYKLETHQYLKSCKMPVTIFHGDQDEVIDYESSVKLKAEFKKGDTLITLHGQGHNGMTENLDYINEISKILQ